MKKFAILFSALCLVVFLSSDSHAQCRVGGGYYGGGVNYFNHYRPNYYRPSIGISYGSYARPFYNYHRPQYYHRPYYGNYYRPGCVRGGITIGF